MWTLKETKEDEGSLLSGLLLSFFIVSILLFTISQMAQTESLIQNSEKALNNDLKFTQIQLYFESLVSRSRGIWIKEGTLLFEYPYAGNISDEDIDPSSIDPTLFNLATYIYEGRSIKIMRIPEKSQKSHDVLFRDLDGFSIIPKSDSYLTLHVESLGETYESFIRLPQRITYLE